MRRRARVSAVSSWYGDEPALPTINWRREVQVGLHTVVNLRPAAPSRHGLCPRRVLSHHGRQEGEAARVALGALGNYVELGGGMIHHEQIKSAQLSAYVGKAVAT